MSDLGPILPLVTTFVRYKIVYLAVRQHTCFHEKSRGERYGATSMTVD